MTGRFEAIAIVGRGCVLPGALDPHQFWDNVRAGRVSIERTPSAAAGRVRGFDDVFDPAGFTAGAAEVAAYDPALRWVLHAGRQALRATGDHASPARTGLVLGNLGYPSRGLVAYAEKVWTGGPLPDPRDRFCSGLWAHTAAALYTWSPSTVPIVLDPVAPPQLASVPSVLIVA